MFIEQNGKVVSPFQYVHLASIDTSADRQRHPSLRRRVQDCPKQYVYSIFAGTRADEIVVVEVPRWTNAKLEISKDEAFNPIKQGMWSSSSVSAKLTNRYQEG